MKLSDTDYQQARDMIMTAVDVLQIVEPTMAAADTDRNEGLLRPAISILITLVEDMDVEVKRTNRELKRRINKERKEQQP